MTYSEWIRIRNDIRGWISAYKRLNWNDVPPHTAGWREGQIEGLRKALSCVAAEYRGIESPI